jgi:hypothetical protein
VLEDRQKKLMGYFFGIREILHKIIMQTPPSTPPSSPTRRSPGRQMQPVDLFGSPKRSRNKSPTVDCSSLQMPSPPKKMKKKATKLPATLKLAPILRKTISFVKLLGKGSFGKVYEVTLPDSPLSVAMKYIRSGTLTAKMLRNETANFGSPGCANGVAMADENGTYYAFSEIAIPLNRMREIGFENLESVIQMTNDALMNAPINVVYDAKPENLGFIPKGTLTVERDENEQPCGGLLTSQNQVKIIDCGCIESPEEADKVFNPLLDDDDIKTQDAQNLFRKFKCEMMEALLRNQFAEIPKDEKLIVSYYCTQYGWRYAGGQQYQPEFQE